MSNFRAWKIKLEILNSSLISNLKILLLSYKLQNGCLVCILENIYTSYLFVIAQMVVGQVTHVVWAGVPGQTGTLSTVQGDPAVSSGRKPATIWDVKSMVCEIGVTPYKLIKTHLNTFLFFYTFEKNIAFFKFNFKFLKPFLFTFPPYTNTDFSTKTKYNKQFLFGIHKCA